MPHSSEECPVVIEKLPYEPAVEQKQAQVEAKIPREWLLDEKWSMPGLVDDNGGVLDIPRQCGILSPTEIRITEDFDATSLLHELRFGALSPKEVTIAHQLTNCLTEISFDKAIKGADELDAQDTFRISGIPSTLGYVSFLKHGPAESDSHLVTVLKSAGAVLFVKMNVPQTLIAADTVINVFGRTLNPHKRSLGPGGNSGGEGSLVGLRGSLVGVGTDIGGSCRVPALCCGLYGFRPTADRVPYGNQVLPLKPGWPSIPAYASPLTTTARDARLFLQTVISAESWDLDCTALPVPWQQVPPNHGKQLSIGLLLEDPAYPVTPPISRTLRTAAKRVEAAGHKVSVLPSFPSIKITYEVTLDLFDIDDDETGIRHVHDGGEPLVQIVRDVLAMSPARVDPKKLSDFFVMNSKRQEETEKWHKVFTQSGYDVLITPSAAHTALPHTTNFALPRTRSVLKK
ncbi:amidase [Ilyonectria destructans]|nr:amidase [Ilyonectria destructans]